MRTFIVFIGSLLLLLACGSHSDPKLNERVQTRLAEVGAPASQIVVRSDDRIVRLDGVVSTDAERERLEREVRTVPGVLAVDSRLRVQAPVGLTSATVGK